MFCLLLEGCTTSYKEAKVLALLMSMGASALSRWTLPYNLRTVIASHTTSMLRVTMENGDDEHTHNECTHGRMEKDDMDEGNTVVSLKLHGVFQYGGDTLKNLINKDLVTPEIQESLLSGEHIGQAQMKVFVDKRLCEPPDSDHNLNLKAPIQKNKANTCILHCIHSYVVETIVVAMRDTDVRLLLLAHYDRMGCTHIYMKTGMYFPVHEIHMLLSIDLVDTLLAFHAITGCDGVSQFSGHGKKTARVVFKQHHTDLIGLGKDSHSKHCYIYISLPLCQG